MSHVGIDANSNANIWTLKVFYLDGNANYKFHLRFGLISNNPHTGVGSNGIVDFMILHFVDVYLN